MSRPKEKDLAAAAALYRKENDFARHESHEELTGRTVAISIRMTDKQLAILKEFARRQGVGYQTLMKHWLDDRIREEALRMRTTKTSEEVIGELKRSFNTAMRELLELQRGGSKAS